MERIMEKKYVDLVAANDTLGNESIRRDIFQGENFSISIYCSYSGPKENEG